MSVCLLHAPPARSQEPAVGVLVGLRGSEATTFRTVWLAPSDGGFGLAVEADQLVVPRRSGFWRLGVLETCRQEPAERIGVAGTGFSLERAQYLWAAAADSVPTVRTATEGESVGPCERQPVACENERRAEVAFVWPDYVSVDNSEVYECGAHPDGVTIHAVRALDHLDASGVTVGAILGSAAGAAFQQAFDQAKAAYLTSWNSACDVAERDDRNWFITRANGGWRVEGWGTGHRLCGYGFDFAVDAPLPRGMAKMDRGAEEGYAGLKERIPDLQDVFWSPGGDVALAVGSDEVRVIATPRGMAPRAVLLRVPRRQGESVVMVEWATGANVGRWTRELVELARRPAPVPHIVPPS